MGLLAFALVGAVVVGPGGPAHALVVPPPSPPVVVGGVVTASRGAVVAGVTCAASGVCLGLTAAAAIGVGLYATRNTWVPMLKRMWENGTSETYPGGTARTQVLHSAHRVGPETYEYSVTDNRQSGSPQPVQWRDRYLCRNGSAFVWGSVVASMNTVRETTVTRQVSCAAGGQIVAGFSEMAGEGFEPAAHYRFASADADVEPVMTYRATSKCVRADGSTQDLVIEYAGQQGPDKGMMVPSCQEAGIGSHASEVTVDGKLPGQTDFTRIWQVQPQAEEAFPECAPNLPTGCLLEVWVDGAACLVGDARCFEWMSHAASRVQCKWGIYTVSLAACDVLEQAYRPGGVALTDGAVDGDPSTGAMGSPGTGTSGETLPQQGTNIDPQTGQPAPGASGGPRPDASDFDGLECIGAEWSWNPVSWVYAPVKCAMVWAFVPRNTNLTDWGDAISAAWPSMPSLDLQTEGVCGVVLTLPQRLGGTSFNVVPICPGEVGHDTAQGLRTFNTGVLTLIFAVSTVGTVTWAFGWSNPLQRLSLDVATGGEKGGLRGSDRG